MPRLPPRPTDIIQLADWLELCALTATDHDASIGDLERALNQGSIMEPVTRGEEASEFAEETISQVFAELELRATAAGSSYPFELAIPRVTAGDSLAEYSTYHFCLCLSYFGWESGSSPGIFPRRIFEELSTEVARQYLHGDAIRFAAPRHASSLPSSFRDAVDRLCQMHLGEGDGYRRQPLLAGQDRKLDIVAWRQALDGLPGKLVLFGNCASGSNWEHKLNELNPGNFCANWMIEVPVSPLIKALFIPHRVDRNRWKLNTRDGGIIFDRCRMASVVKQLPLNANHGDAMDWMRGVLARF